jgi:FAD dependent oxidoreductase TIGR03364
MSNNTQQLGRSMEKHTQRVGIVGAGIVGLAHAWSAAERGHQVTVFERSPRAFGASIRNFGMVWVIGQPDQAQDVANNSRERWLRAGREGGLWVSPCGSIHMAHRDDEWAVLQEYAAVNQSGPRGSWLKLLTANEVLQRSPAANPNGLLGGLWSDRECCVDPTSAIRSIPPWLERQYGVQFHFSTAVVHAESGQVGLASGQRHVFDRIIICSGDDLATLRPEVFHGIPLRASKLHMMRTTAQTEGFRIGPHLAGGLTLRHYPNFKTCGSLQALSDRIESETPELNQFGIHVMASQNHRGEVVLGDSHEYGDAIEPFDRQEIDGLILRELHKILKLPHWNMESHWHGVYAKYTEGLVFEAEPEPGLHICTGLGGNGMTLSFGIAERAWNRWEPKNE